MMKEEPKNKDIVVDRNHHHGHHDDEEDDNTSNNHTHYYSSHYCDRRLSRAARRLMERDVMPILLHHFDENEQQYDDTTTPNNNNIIPTTMAPLRLWNILEASIIPDNINNCPLHPSRDVFREDEIQSLVSKSKPRSNKLSIINTKRQQQPQQQWYTCGICGKVFSSRYYLDVHLQNHHHHHHAHIIDDYKNNEDWMICPAETWCEALGGHSTCQQVALEMEPYYGRGGTSRDDAVASSIRHGWSRIAHAWHCQEEEMQKAQTKCRSIMSLCFLTSNNNNPQYVVLDDLHQAVCDGLTCQNALHRMMGYYYMSQQFVHTWKDEWNSHVHFNFGFWGFTVVLGLMVFYILRGVQAYCRRRRRRGKQHQLFCLGKKKRHQHHRLFGTGRDKHGKQL